MTNMTNRSNGDDGIIGNHGLISLEDIIKRQTGVEQPVIESYTMIRELSQESLHRALQDEVVDKTLVVKRANLIFNDKECLVLNFSDITAMKLLKHEEQKT